MLDEALIAAARAAGIDLSKVAEEGIARALAKVRAERWRTENTTAIERYDQRILRDGLFSDGLRRF